MRASLEELRLDYEDFLRQRGLPLLPADHPVLVRFKERRCASLQDVQEWVASELADARRQDRHGQPRTSRDSADLPQSVSVPAGQCAALPSSALVANAALSLLNLACHLLDRQLASQAECFEKEGGFTERLYRVRSAARRRSNR